jgi:hypothetical protein
MAASLQRWCQRFNRFSPVRFIAQTDSAFWRWRPPVAAVCRTDRKRLVRSAGFEPATPRFEVWCSIRAELRAPSPRRTSARSPSAQLPLLTRCALLVNPLLQGLRREPRGPRALVGTQCSAPEAGEHPERSAPSRGPEPRPHDRANRIVERRHRLDCRGDIHCRSDGPDLRLGTEWSAADELGVALTNHRNGSEHQPRYALS